MTLAGKDRDAAHRPTQITESRSKTMTNRTNSTVIAKYYLLVAAVTILITCILARPAAGLTYIRDIARPLGQRTNKLSGLGIIVGLKDTGDGSDFLMTARSLRALLEKHGSPALDLAELTKAKNCALAIVTAELGPHGVREGDRIDVNVHSFGTAKSLAGGTLFLTPLRSSNYADDHIYAWVQGPITIANADIPTSGIVKGGANINCDFIHDYIDMTTYPGRAVFTLVLDDNIASFAVAKSVAMMINEEMAPPGTDLASASGAAAEDPIAEVLDSKNIRIFIPPKRASTRNSASLFIAHVLGLSVDLPDPQALVVINQNAGTIAITGSVEIAPVVVTVNGLVIRVAKPKPVPRPGQTVVTETEWTKFDTNNSGGIKIDQLMSALEQLNVPVEDKINVLYTIKNAGALRADIITTD